MEIHTKYKLTKKLLLAFIIALQPIIIKSQTDYDNHSKYWYYKTRLNNDFMKVGLLAGESIVFNQRSGNHTADMNVGDATATLGYYIGVLATEYYLLQQNNQNTDIVKHELFCALNAINRVDYKAEGHWQYGAEQLNGFFVRDDIDATFVKNNYNHFNYYNNCNGVLGDTSSWNYFTGLPIYNDTYKGFTQVHSKGQYLNNSALKHFQTYTTTSSEALNHREVSQDQTII